MIIRNSKTTLMLLLAGLLVMLVATACGVPNAEGLFVNMNRPGTTADGLDYDTNDILLSSLDEDTGAAGGWVVAFDGEWYGLNDRRHNLEAFSFNEMILNDNLIDSVGPDDANYEMELYLSFEQNRTRVPGIAERAYGQDIIKLNVTSPEPFSPVDADYSYQMFFDGSDVGLTTMAEKLDGISVWAPAYYDGINIDVAVPYDCPAAVIFLSTRSNYRVSPTPDGGDLTGVGSDVLAFCATNTGVDTAGFWFRVFDSQAAGIQPRQAITGLDVWGLEYLGDDGDPNTPEFNVGFFFTPRRDFTALDLNGGPVAGGPSDLFGAGTSGTEYGVEGPLANFNLGGDGAPPAVNGLVESIGIFDFPFTSAPTP